MNTVSSIQSAGKVINSTPNRGSAASEEVRESNAERVKETRQGEEAAKAPPTAEAGNSVNLLV